MTSDMKQDILYALSAIPATIFFLVPIHFVKEISFFVFLLSIIASTLFSIPALAVCISRSMQFKSFLYEKNYLTVKTSTLISFVIFAINIFLAFYITDSLDKDNPYVLLAFLIIGWWTYLFFTPIPVFFLAVPAALFLGTFVVVTDVILKILFFLIFILFIKMLLELLGHIFTEK